MMRSVVRAVVRNATVTATAPAYAPSLHVDAVILRAALLIPYEEVAVINAATGDRFTTFVEPSPDGSGEVALHAGERHPVRVGDVISIVAFGHLHDGQTLAHTARVVTLDAQNRLVTTEDRGVAI